MDKDAKRKAPSPHCNRHFLTLILDLNGIDTMKCKFPSVGELDRCFGPLIIRYCTKPKYRPFVDEFPSHSTTLVVKDTNSSNSTMESVGYHNITLHFRLGIGLHVFPSILTDFHRTSVNLRYGAFNFLFAHFEFTL
jgi:hypothetical protein